MLVANQCDMSAYSIHAKSGVLNDEIHVEILCKQSCYIIPEVGNLSDLRWGGDLVPGHCYQGFWMYVFRVSLLFSLCICGGMCTQEGVSAH